MLTMMGPALSKYELRVGVTVIEVWFALGRAGSAAAPITWYAIPSTRTEAYHPTIYT